MALSIDMTFVLSHFAVTLGRICILHWVHVFTGCFNIPVFFVVFIKKPGLDCSDSCLGLSLNASPNMGLVLYLCWVFLFPEACWESKSFSQSTKFMWCTIRSLPAGSSCTTAPLWRRCDFGALWFFSKQRTQHRGKFMNDLWNSYT